MHSFQQRYGPNEQPKMCVHTNQIPFFVLSHSEVQKKIVMNPRDARFDEDSS